MRAITFAGRNRKELTRDPVSAIFGIGLPVVLLLIITAIQRNVPVSIFEIGAFAPGIAVFSLSFTAMFACMLLSKDRSSSFLSRLFASPMGPADFLLGYALPLLPLAALQCIACFGAAVPLGLPFTMRIFAALLALIPAMVLFIGFGLLFGCILSDRQAGPIMSILVQVVAFTSGMWFDVELLGGVYAAICNLLPFLHAVKAAQAAINGQWAQLWPHLIWCAGYAAAIFSLAVVLFRRKMVEAA